MSTVIVWGLVAIMCVATLAFLIKMPARAPIAAAPVTLTVELRFVTPGWHSDALVWRPVRIGDRMIPHFQRAAIECGLEPSRFVTPFVIDAIAAHLAGQTAQLEAMAESLRVRGLAVESSMLAIHAKNARERERTDERHVLVVVEVPPQYAAEPPRPIL